jgi:Ricin-type beta-trefoil lectin domain
MDTTMRRLSKSVMARVHSAENERGVAMFSAIIFMIIMAGLSTALLSTVLAQNIPVYVAQKGTQTINTAQAGMEAAMGLIRTATDVDGSGATYGDPSELPCTVTGKPNAQVDGLSYSVQISYFVQDPTGKDPTWQAANDLNCSSTSGITDSVSGVLKTPNYALIAAKGIGSNIPGSASTTLGNRSVQAIYKFMVSAVNIPGGRIYDFAGGYCLDATAATAGSTVRFLAAASCTNNAKELWVYATDYEIKLASTVTTSNPGLCITGPAVAGGATQNATLQACKNNAQRWNQLWSWQGAYSWQGQNPDITSGPSGYCLSTGVAADGSNLTGLLLQVSSTGCVGRFGPTAEVGAGAASYTTNQVVNYDEFGRCLDVTNEDITSSFMISFPCKQDATGTGAFLLWNHKWYYTEAPSGTPIMAPQQIYVKYLENAAAKYCLTTPSQTASPAYVTFVPCTTTLPTGSQQGWVRFGVSQSGGYAASYLFKDTFGRCLAVDPSDTYNTWSKIVVTTCDGSLGQKWNAPPGNSVSSVGGYKETSP